MPTPGYLLPHQRLGSRSPASAGAQLPFVRLSPANATAWRPRETHGVGSVSIAMHSRPWLAISLVRAPVPAPTCRTRSPAGGGGDGGVGSERRENAVQCIHTKCRVGDGTRQQGGGFGAAQEAQDSRTGVLVQRRTVTAISSTPCSMSSSRSCQMTYQGVSSCSPLVSDPSMPLTQLWSWTLSSHDSSPTLTSGLGPFHASCRVPHPRERRLGRAEEAPLVHVVQEIHSWRRRPRKTCTTKRARTDQAPLRSLH